MSQQLNSSRMRGCAYRLSGYLAVLAALLLAIIVAPYGHAQTACNVVYTISPQNTSAFGAAITIENTGTTAWTSWTLTWTFANGQSVSQLWNGIETQSGANVTVKNEPYNGSVAAGGSVTGVGFNGAWNGTTNAVPTSFAVNGTTCGAPAGGFTLKPSAATLSVAQGASATDTITVTDGSPFTGSVTFAATGLPSGVTASFSPASSTGSSVLTLTASSTAAVGTSTVAITGTSGSLTATTTIALTVTTKLTFTLTVPTLSITQGKTTTDTITITDVGGFTGNVSLAVSNLPSGITCTFGTNPATSTTDVMTCTASATATVGSFMATITGTSSSITVTATFPVTIVSSAGGFTLNPSVTSCTIPQGSSCTVTISVKDISPFTGSVTLAATGLPSGVTATFATNPTASTSVLTLTASATATIGSFTVTITGTSGSLTSSTTIALTVTAGFSISSSCGGGLTLQQGGSATCTITVTGATGTPTISLTGLPSGVSASVTNPTSTTFVITLTASATATLGTSTITVTVTSGTTSKSIIIPVTITTSSGTGSFTITPTASTLVIGLDAGGTDTINVTDVGGFTGAVTLTASGMPSGVTAAFGTNPTTGSSVLTLIASSTAATGTSTITIQGTSTGTSSGTLSATTTIALTVSATPSVQIAWVSPTAGIAGSTFTVMPGVGASFAETQGSSVINFGTTAATVTTWAIDSIAVTVPSLAVGTYNVTAVVDGVTSNAVPFTITSATPSPEVYTGNSTWFSALGSPYGGCGVPQANIDSQNFVALNVQNDPGNYSLTLSRPISTTGPDAADIGMWNNGLNCGRWVHITMGSNCEGTNDGSADESFCRGGLGWVPDQFNGAEIDSVVADSCQDENSWCRDDPYHLDQAQAQLSNYTLNGEPAGDIYPNFWNNRQISWYFEPAPNYTGDINIGFLNGANAYWSAISITHLPNGIHGVQYLLNGVWTTAVMDADLGDDYIVLPTVAGGTQYEIQVFDVTNTLINSGRIYSFTYPSSCGSSCTPAITPVTFTTSQ
ncbi:MAG: cellulose binding domain-containing protein [Terracidiphilus sp.]